MDRNETRSSGRRIQRRKAADGGQDLRQLRKTVSALGIGFLLQTMCLAALAWKYYRVVHALDLVSENIHLLSMRLDLFAETFGSIQQSLGNILEVIESLGLTMF